jgi:hypothetical protein
VLGQLYQPLQLCTNNTESIRAFALNSVYGALQAGGMPIANAQDTESSPVQGLATQALASVSYCTTAVRLIHHVPLSGPLARNTTLRHVLDQSAAYAAADAGGDYDYVKVAADMQGDDVARTKVDMDNAANAWHSADGHLSMVASYIGKL